MPSSPQSWLFFPLTKPVIQAYPGCLLTAQSSRCLTVVPVPLMAGSCVDALLERPFCGSRRVLPTSRTQVQHRSSRLWFADSLNNEEQRKRRVAIFCDEVVISCHFTLLRTSGASRRTASRHALRRDSCRSRAPRRTPIPWKPVALAPSGVWSLGAQWQRASLGILWREAMGRFGGAD